MMVRVKCKRNTTDSAYHYYRQDQEYTVSDKHPCMKHFEPLEEIKEKDFKEKVKDESAT